jgi:hypothetical protein
MESNQLNSPSHKGQGKSAHFQAQMKRVFAAFHRQPKTMLMVSSETGIMRSNITRYVAKWKKLDCIKIVRLGTCPISKSAGVQYLTANPKLFSAIVEPSKLKGYGQGNTSEHLG